MNYKIIELESHGDKDGQLVAMEELNEIPFNIKRVFHIFDTKPGVIRGKHAHKTLHEVLVCVSGSCKILLKDGEREEDIKLDSPTKGLYIPPEMWREMYEFEQNTVLLVLASDKYDIDDYIKPYDKYLKWRKIAE